MSTRRQTQPSGRIRQKDIAAAAGVTRSTVSIILSGKSAQGHIAPATRDRVLDIARRLGYQSNPLAQRLNGINSRLIGVHTYGHDMSYTAMNYNTEYLMGIQERVTELRYDLVLFTSSTHEGRRSSAFPNGGNRLSVADGTVIIGYRPDHHELARLRDEGYKFVRVDRRDVPGVPVPWVDSDHETGTVDMVRSLLQAGYERLLYVGSTNPTDPFLDRQRGYRDAIDKFSLPTNSISLTSSAAATRHWMESMPTKPAPTLIAEGWTQAHVLAECAESMRLHTPIAVLQSPHLRWQSDLYCAYFMEPRVEIGRRAVDMVVAQIEDRPHPLNLLIPGKVLVRAPNAQSTDPGSWPCDWSDRAPEDDQRHRTRGRATSADDPTQCE